MIFAPRRSDVIWYSVTGAIRDVPKKKPKTIEVTYCSDMNALALLKKLKYPCTVRFFAQGDLGKYFLIS